MADEIPDPLTQIHDVHRVHVGDNDAPDKHQLLGRVWEHDGRTEVLADYHGHLEGTKDVASLKRSPYLRVVSRADMRDGMHPDLLKEHEFPSAENSHGVVENQPRPPSVFTYHHPIMQTPQTIEARDGNMYMNGGLLSALESHRIMENVRNQVAQVRYAMPTHTIAKMERVFTNLSKAKDVPFEGGVVQDAELQNNAKYAHQLPKNVLSRPVIEGEMHDRQRAQAVAFASDPDLGVAPNKSGYGHLNHEEAQQNNASQRRQLGERGVDPNESTFWREAKKPAAPLPSTPEWNYAQAMVNAQGSLKQMAHTEPKPVDAETLAKIGGVYPADSAWMKLDESIRNPSEPSARHPSEVGWVADGPRTVSFHCPYCSTSIGSNLKGDFPFAEVRRHLELDHNETLLKHKLRTGQQAWDYSDHLDPVEREQGHKLIITQGLEKYDNQLIVFKVDKDGQGLDQAWGAYPTANYHPPINVADISGAHSALTNHVRWIRSNKLGGTGPWTGYWTKAEAYLTNLSKVEPDLAAKLGFVQQAERQGHLPEGTHRRLAREIFVDPMVEGVGNKKAYEDFLARPRGGVHIDLDANDFGQINKVHSFEHGNQAITSLGNAIRDSRDEAVGQKNGKVFRVGGDEFRVHVPTHEHAARFMRALRGKLEAIPPVGGTHNLSVSAGFGATPEHANQAGNLAKRAKKAMSYQPGQAKTHVHSLLPGREGAIPVEPEPLPEPPKHTELSVPAPAVATSP